MSRPVQLTCATCGIEFIGRDRSDRGQQRYFCQGCGGHPKGAASHAWKGKNYRAIAAAQIGRELVPGRTGEDVHHINGDHNDNRPENLQVLPHSEHTALHAPGADPEIRAKISATLKGRKVPAEVRARMSAGQRAKPHVSCVGCHREFVIGGPLALHMRSCAEVLRNR